MQYHKAAGRYLLAAGIVLCVGMAVGFIYGLLHDALFFDFGPVLMILIGSGVYHGSRGWRKFGIVVCFLYVAAAAALLFVAIFSPDSLRLTFGGVPAGPGPALTRTLALVFSLLYITVFGMSLYLLLHPWTKEEKGDWRLAGQEKYLKGVTLVHRKYRLYARNPDWDHDHCSFCWAVFMVGGESGSLDEGYSTEDEYHWICPQCFEDFKETFGWSVREE